MDLFSKPEIVLWCSDHKKIMSVRRNYTFILTENEIYCKEIGETLQTYSDRDEAEKAFESLFESLSEGKSYHDMKNF